MERMTTEQLVDALKKYANEHYEEDGWDFVVEAMDRDEIAKELREAGAATLSDAIEVVGSIAKLLDERRREIRSTAF